MSEQINEEFKAWKQNYKCDDSYDHGYNIRDMQAAFLAGQQVERVEFAELVKSMEKPCQYTPHIRNMHDEGYSEACEEIAASIRSRREG